MFFWATCPRNSLYKTKKIPFSRDTIYLENESLNASYFKLLDANNTAINSTLYNVDFLKGTLLLKEIFCLSDSITVEYLKYPDFFNKRVP
jgi:hypothetical protein